MFIYTYKTAEEIPAEHKDFYEERDGAFFLKVPGVVPKEKHDKMREKVETLDKELKALQIEYKKFDGIDPEKARAVLLREQEIMDAKLIKNDKVEELIQQRLAGVKSENERQIKAKDDALAEKDTQLGRLTGSLKKVKIDNTLLKEAHERGLEPGAEPFLLAAAEKDWDLDEDGHPVVKGGDGKVIYGKDGDPMKPGEWMDNLASKSPFMFKGNKGTNAQGKTDASGNRITSGNGEINWWKTEHWNPTEQMKIYGKDPALAERMAAQAGRKIGDAPPILPRQGVSTISTVAK